MHFKVYLVILIFLSLTNCADIAARRNLNSKKDSRQNHKSKSLHIHEQLMDNLFIVYDPSFLALVWSKIKNGVHLNLDRYCWSELSVFFKDYLDGRAWAYKTADATGRYSGSFFSGNKFWLGSIQQCRMLNEAYESREENETWGEFYSGDYLNALLRKEKTFGKNQQDWHGMVERDELLRRVLAADGAPPFALQYSTLKLQLNLTKLALAKSYDVTLGVCLPRSCAADDIVSIVNFSIMLNDHLKSNNSLSRSIKITSLRQPRGYDIRDDIVAVLTILITIIFIILAVVATLVDLDLFAVKKNTLDLNVNKILNKKDKPVVVDAVMKTGTLKMSEPPSITLGVMKTEATGNCRRCGKYRKQCAVTRQFDNFPPCPRMRYNSCTSLNMEYKKKNGHLKGLLLSFSIKHSWMRIFNTNMANKDLAVLHVVKIAVTLWVIFIHVAVNVSYVSNSGDINEHNSVYYVLATGTLAFDTVFFVSGVFSAHHFFYLKGRYSDPAGCGPCGHAMQLLCFICNRAIRLLPPYVYTIFLASVLARVSQESAALSLPVRDFANCHVFWWRNVLYINNFYRRDEQCMQISWWLSAETQLHVLGAVLCYALSTARQRVAASVTVLIVFAAVGADVFSAPEGFRIADAFSAYNEITSRPWSRVAPYLLGVLAAWLLHRIDGLLTVTRLSSWCFWVGSGIAAVGTVAAAALGAGVAGAAGVVGGGVTVNWLASLLAGWLHLSWPAAWLWPAIVCSSKYAYRTRQLLDSRVTAGLSRLCYCALLLHAPISQYLLLSTDNAHCAHFVCVLNSYAGVTAVTIVAAFCLSMLVEMPTCSFLRRLSDLAYR